jgi:hypothetical protein
MAQGGIYYTADSVHVETMYIVDNQMAGLSVTQRTAACMMLSITFSSSVSLGAYTMILISAENMSDRLAI